MIDRVLIQNCETHKSCVVHTLIEAEVTIFALPDVPIVDALGTVHAQGWQLADGEPDDKIKSFTAHDFVAWTSHATAAAHHACRIGKGGKWDQTVALDHTVAEAGQLMDDPPVVKWEPMCTDCHVIFGHATMPHHAAGLARRADGTLLVHSDHPMADVLTVAGAELHGGTSWADCPRCAPIADSCDGCRLAVQG